MNIEKSRNKKDRVRKWEELIAKRERWSKQEEKRKEKNKWRMREKENKIKRYQIHNKIQRKNEETYAMK